MRADNDVEWKSVKNKEERNESGKNDKKKGGFEIGNMTIDGEIIVFGKQGT